MTNKILIYSANAAEQTLAVGDQVDFGSVVRRIGKITMTGGNVLTKVPGYYDVDVNITFSDLGAGVATFTLYRDGSPVPGAEASVTTGATAVTHSVTIPAVIRKTCCSESEIAVVVTGAGATVTNAAIRVERA